MVFLYCDISITLPQIVLLFFIPRVLHVPKLILIIFWRVYLRIVILMYCLTSRFSLQDSHILRLIRTNYRQGNGHTCDSFRRVYNVGTLNWAIFFYLKVWQKSLISSKVTVVSTCICFILNHVIIARAHNCSCIPRQIHSQSRGVADKLTLS